MRSGRARSRLERVDLFFIRENTLATLKEDTPRPDLPLGNDCRSGAMAGRDATLARASAAGWREPGGLDR